MEIGPTNRSQQREGGQAPSHWIGSSFLVVRFDHLTAPKPVRGRSEAIGIIKLVKRVKADAGGENPIRLEANRPPGQALARVLVWSYDMVRLESNRSIET